MASLTEMTAQEAASLIKNGEAVGIGGFTPAGSPKVIIPALASKARLEHQAGRPFRVKVFSGASTADTVDEELSAADAVEFRAPYISNKVARSMVNSGRIRYMDLTLSTMATQLRQGFLGPLDWAVVTASDLEVKDGMARIYLTTGIGVSPTICQVAEKGVFVELNDLYLGRSKGLHDIYELESYPNRRPIPIVAPADRVGLPYIEIPASKVKGVVHMSADDSAHPFTPPTEVTDRIGHNVADFLLSQLREGLIPRERIILQSGVGSGANAVLHALGSNPEVPHFNLYTEVLQDAALELVMNGRIDSASSCSLTVTAPMLEQVYGNIDYVRRRVVLRPSEISNNPEVIARLGVISMNTALEVDLYGHANSTKVLGTQMMNGLGGSSDFTNSSYLSVYTCGSTAKGGKISSIVPFVSHVDQTQHYVDAVVTEYGVAMLRNLPDLEKARALIAVAHPDYRPILTEYLRLSEAAGGQAHHTLSAAFALHDTFMRKGDMRLVDWSEYLHA